MFAPMQDVYRHECVMKIHVELLPCYADGFFAGNVTAVLTPGMHAVRDRHYAELGCFYESFGKDVSKVRHWGKLS